MRDYLLYILPYVNNILAMLMIICTQKDLNKLLDIVIYDRFRIDKLEKVILGNDTKENEKN